MLHRGEHGPVRLDFGISSVFKIENRNRRFGFGFSLKKPGSVIIDSVSVTKPTTIKLKNNMKTLEQSKPYNTKMLRSI